MQDEYAEQNGQQRVDEIAQARFDDVLGIDSPDVDAPIDSDDGGCQCEAAELAAIGDDVTNSGPATGDGEDGADEYQRPDHSVRQNLDRVGRLQQRPVQREQPPQQVGTGAEDQPISSF